MDPLVATLILVLLAILGARVSFSPQRVPTGPRMLLTTGVHFLVLGYLLGPGGLGLFGGDGITRLQPLVALGLGWVGLLFGMQLDRESLRQFPPSFHLLALGQAAVAFGLFLGMAMAALHLLGHGGAEARVMAWGAAATACMATPAGVAMVSTSFLARGRLRELLFFIASLDALVGVVALQVAYALYPSGTLMAGAAPRPAVLLVLLALGLGIVCGVVLVWLLRPRPGKEELVVYLLGVTALASGTALHLQLSPVFVCVVMGAVVANLDPDRTRVYQALERWEKPIYVVLLLLVGALMTIPTWWVVPLAAAYALARGAAKWMGGALMASLVPMPFPVPRSLGLGLLPQGGISLALAVSIFLTYSGLALPDGTAAAELVFGVIVGGVVLSELVGPVLTARLLTSAGEIRPRAVEALREGDEERAREEVLGAPPSGQPPDETP